VSGYGISPYGTGLYGYATPPPPMEFTRVVAVSDRVVQVVLSVEPLHLASTGAGDALNPSTWGITVPSTGRVLTPIAVEMIDAFTYNILTLQSFDSALVDLQLTTSTLLDSNSVPFPALSAIFKGAYASTDATNDKRTAASGYALSDLANKPTAIQDYVGGTLEISAGGDYVTETGPELLKKLIIRRVVSKPGDFFHLPKYGVGLREKEPLPVVDLRKLAKAIEMQVAEEPEVAEVKASLSYAASAGTLNIGLKVRMRTTGQQVAVAMAVPTGAVQL
jgi:hypothetical protein